MSVDAVDVVLASFRPVERRDRWGLIELEHPDVEFHWPPSLPCGGPPRDKVASGVIVPPLHNPLELAKALASIDVVSTATPISMPSPMSTCRLASIVIASNDTYGSLERCDDMTSSYREIRTASPSDGNSGVWDVDLKGELSDMAIESDHLYHSIREEDPDVHHFFEDCPNGQQILPENRRDGTNGWPLCGSCDRMQS